MQGRGVAFPVREWGIAIGLSLGCAVATGLARFAYGLVLPAMRADLAWTYAEAGWINTANALGYLLGAVLTLALIKRLGAGPLYIVGMVMVSAALLASAATRDLAWLSAWRILAGVGGAPVFIGGGAMASTLFRGERVRNAAAIAIFFGGGGFGIALSGMILPLLLERQGAGSWPMAWFILGTISATFTVANMLAVFAVMSRAPPRGDGASATAPLPIARMLPILAAYTMFAFGYIVYFTFITAWMREQAARTDIVIATWVVLGAASILSPFVWSRVLAAARGGGSMALALAATCFGATLPLLGASDAMFLLSAFLFGLSFFAVPASITSFTRKNLAEGDWGRSVAFFTVLFAVGQTAGPVVGGAIADRFGSLAPGLATAAMILALAASVALFQRRLGRSA